MREAWEWIDNMPLEVFDIGHPVVFINQLRLRARGSGVEFEFRAGFVLWIERGLIVRECDFWIRTRRCAWPASLGRVGSGRRRRVTPGRNLQYVCCNAREAAARATLLLFDQLDSLGPRLGRLSHFRFAQERQRSAPRSPHAARRTAKRGRPLGSIDDHQSVAAMATKSPEPSG
jgi:hypothetical protein